MNCLEFRRLLGTEPASREAAFIAHRDSCRACAAAWRQAQHFELRLQRSLAVAAPEGLVERALLAQATGVRQQRRRRRFVLAMAACVLLVFAGGGLLWRHAAQQAHAQQQLAAFAVAHMPEEMPALTLTRDVAPAMVVADFADRGLALPGPIPAGTTYVHRCIIGPYKGVHLVTRVDGEPVVVLYLPHTQLDSQHRFAQGGWRGMEVPLAHGSMVVMTNGGDSAPMIAAARAWKHAIEGDPQRHRLAALLAPARQALPPRPRQS